MKIYKSIDVYEVSLVEHPANPHCTIRVVGLKENNE